MIGGLSLPTTPPRRSRGVNPVWRAKIGTAARRSTRRTNCRSNSSAGRSTKTSAARSTGTSAARSTTTSAARNTFSAAAAAAAAARPRSESVPPKRRGKYASGEFAEDPRHFAFESKAANDKRDEHVSSRWIESGACKLVKKTSGMQNRAAPGSKATRQQPVQRSRSLSRCHTSSNTHACACTCSWVHVHAPATHRARQDDDEGVHRLL